RWDVIVDVGGTRRCTELERALAPNGRLVLVGAPKSAGALVVRLFEGLVLSRFHRGRMMFTARVTADDLLALRDLAEAGKLVPAIDRTYPLREVSDAFRYFGTGGVRGKVVIQVA